jgi:hypothetical protein
MRQGNTARRSARALTAAVAALAMSLTLASCIFDAQQNGLTVVNNTSEDLTIRDMGQRRGDVPKGTTRDLVFGTGCNGGIDAITSDGSQVAKPPDELCDGDTWTIEQSDLVPTPEPSPSPTS